MIHRILSVILTMFLCTSNILAAQQKPIARFHSITSVTSAIQKNQFTCRQLINEYIHRILSEDMAYSEKQLPLNSIAYINPYALEQAEKLDDYFKSTQKLKGTMHCTPVLVKDNIHTIDMPTQVGSYVMQNSWPAEDATIIKRLKNQGAIILAKTAMAEFAMPPSDTNSLIGVTGNAYDSNLTSGGSSSGVASGVAYGFGVVGIGSDNSGSIRGPAGLNGLLGLRPSYGQVSVQGTFPLGELNGIFGPIVYDFNDCITVLNIISGEDKKDFRTLGIKPLNIDSKKMLARNLKGKRIGIIRVFKNREIKYAVDKQSKHIFDTVIDHLKEMHLKIIDGIDLGDFNTDNSDLLVGSVEYIDNYLKQGFSPRIDFKDFCKSDRSDRLGITKDCLARIKNDPGTNSELYKSKRKMFKDNSVILKKIMDDNDLDALLYLIQHPFFAERKEAKEHLSFIASNAGAPAMVIRGPMTTHHPARPTFFQLLGRRFTDDVVLSIVGQYDHQWRPPRPVINPPRSGMTFHDVSSFNNYKRQLAPRLHKYMKDKNINTDSLTRDEWTAFLLLAHTPVE